VTRFVVVALWLVSMVASLATGGGAVGARQASSPVAGAGEPIRIAFVYVGSVNDGGWTEAHDNGRVAIEEQIPEAETAYQENVSENPADSERVIRGFAEAGYDVIFTTSFGFMDATLNVAADFPEATFIHISGYKTAPNVGTGFGKQEEPRYVSGILSGRMTTSNVIGYVAAFPIPEVIRGINAFTLGARSVNPDVVVRVVWTNTWFDPQKERAAAEALLDGGADVIAQHQDTPAPQQAAQARGALGIGNDLDMSPAAPDAVMTTPIWNWGVYYVQVAREVQAGTWTSGQYWGGWKDGVVDLAPIGPMVPDDIRAEAEAEVDRFRSGEKTLTTVFTGPLTDQDGAERIAAGVAMTDAEILSMNWFVAGIEGDIPA